MDAITLLQQDHKTIEALFKKFEKAGENAMAPDTPPGDVVAGAGAALVDRVRDKPSSHTRATA
jgi:uncharacterized protein (UPF0371 family)